MSQAAFLNEGDQIRIISTARKISQDELTPAIRMLKSWGLKVSLGENIQAVSHQFAGTKAQRQHDLQTALDDPNVKAILCARGGYGTIQLIDELDFTAFRIHPKWLIGYSDITALHNHINQNFGIETLHATMPINFPIDTIENKSTQSLKDSLFGVNQTYEFEAKSPSLLNFESLEGRLYGGNLSIIYSLTGTSSQLKKENSILFFEDLDEYLYHIDRMLMNLRRAGLFNGCKAVIVGGMSDMNDNTVPYGATAEEIIKENLEEYGIPVIFGFPAGHVEPNLALRMGAKVRLENKNGQIKLVFNGRA
ncbi:MAG: LD-carboxypeptidase [Verrucomicrobia bacterium]|nr:LD-carboxypeptidase [Verrucomicrobiota bacterium]|tara:strand:+ start:1336 stop:2256 length:921 start_codon:yes stop_codon:yes gene_type:complete